jgi:hypothetical protein
MEDERLGLENRIFSKCDVASLATLYSLPPHEVLDISTSNGHGLIRRDSTICSAIFIDESRLMVLTCDIPTGDLELVTFNTLIPQDDPSNSRRFNLPSWHTHWGAPILVDCDRPLGTPDIDGPLVADPAQAILVMEFPASQDPSVLVIVRTQALIGYACSPRAGFDVPWGDWGKGAVVMEVPRHCDYISTSVHGTKVVVQTYTGVRLGHYPSYRIHTFDFSRRGSSSLQLLNEVGGGTEREALFDNGLGFQLEGSEGMSSWASLESLGGGSLFYLVSCFYRSIGSKVVG